LCVVVWGGVGGGLWEISLDNLESTGCASPLL